jgi:Ca2+-binding EF-hand superfamily protein
MPEKQAIERARSDKRQGTGAEERARLREDFDYNDLNHDGRLTLGEFIRFMRNVDEDLTAEQCEIGFDEIDTNRDGAIEFEEFVAWSTRR